MSARSGSFPDDSGAAIVLTVANAAEAEALIKADPAVSEGVFHYRIHPWAPVPWQQYVK
ncbi:YciI family protein [Pseudoxanthomonas putridarboris]|uniref:YciI family protein n=1 Tax=Pseudoxanthomonas putridarboris TaxID=752605 RepID=A0ABU9IXI0_9GAMM